MNAHFSNISSILKTQMSPGPSSISGFAHAIAMRDIASDGRLAHTNIHDIRIGVCDSNRPNRRAFKEAVGYIFPYQSTIGCFPETPTRRAKIKDQGMHWISRYRDNPSTTKWADKAPLKRMK